MIKWTAVLGIIFCLAGIGVITAGAMMGGADELEDYLEFKSCYTPYRGQAVEITEGFAEKNAERFADEFGNGFADEFADGKAALDAGTLMDTASYERVRKLSIEAGPGEVLVMTEDRENPQDTAIRVECYAKEGSLTYPYRIRQEEDELEIERHDEFQNIVGPFKDRVDDYKNRRMETLVICIPRDYRFREVEIEAAASSVTVDEIRADKLSLELMAGTLTVNNGNVKQLDAECKAGSMYLGLEGKKEQFDYELTSNVGTIVLADEEEESYTGLRREKHIDNRAEKRAELECDVGELYIRFTEN